MKIVKAILFECILLLMFPRFIMAENYYLGDGGSSVRLVVLRPSGESLAKEDEFVLDFFQTLLFNNFTKYTAVKTSKQDTVTEKQEVFLLISKLAKTGAVYMLELTVTDSSSGLRKASYLVANIKADAILNGRAVNEGFLDIIKKLNINLSDSGISAVKNPSREDILAAINLARGNTAEKNGNPIEMLTYLYNAASYNPDLLEADNRFDALSRMLSSGDVGESVKSDIDDREKWKQILDEFDNFYQKHPPFTLQFNPIPTQKGLTDYDNRTAILEFELRFQEDVGFNAMQKVFGSIAAGIKNTKKQEQWGFALRPYRSPLFNTFKYYEVKAELVNNRNETVGAAVFSVRSRIFVLRNTLFADTSQKQKANFKPIHIDTALTADMIVKIVSINKIETEKAMQDGYIQIVPAEKLPNVKPRSLLVLMTRSISG